MDTTTIAVDLAKSVFQVSLAGPGGRIIDRRRLSRTQLHRFLAQQPPAEIVMETCATAHYWAREAGRHGHRQRLLHAHYVRPYVRRNKTDSADADALVRASQDADLKPVPVKSEDQQVLQSLHRIRSQWQATRRQRICLARGLLGEFGLHLPTGASGIVARLNTLIEGAPTVLATVLSRVTEEIAHLDDKLRQLDRELTEIAKHNEVAQRLLTIPGIGVVTATAMIASVPDIHAFSRARQFSAWLGITPREYSSGQTRHLGSITKKGDRYLRTLLIHGARSALLMAHRQSRHGETSLTRLQHWVLDVERRTNHNKATVALANKLGRIVWAAWTKEETYRA